MSGAVIHKGAKLHRTVVPPQIEVPEGYEFPGQQDEVVLLTQEQLDEWKERGGK